MKYLYVVVFMALAGCSESPNIPQHTETHLLNMSAKAANSIPYCPPNAVFMAPTNATPPGSDGNVGTSEEFPVLSIARAIEVLESNSLSFINIKPGNYYDPGVKWVKENSDYVEIRGCGGVPVFTSSADTDSAFIIVRGGGQSTNVCIRNVEVRDYYKYGVLFAYANNNSVQNCVFQEFYDSVDFSGGDRYQLWGLIELSFSHYNDISGNIFMHNEVTYGAHSLYLQSSSDNVIWDNQVLGEIDGSAPIKIRDDSDGNEFFNNLVIGSGARSYIDIVGTLDAGWPQGTRVYNNTFLGHGDLSSMRDKPTYEKFTPFNITRSNFYDWVDIDHFSGNVIDTQEPEWSILGESISAVCVADDISLFSVYSVNEDKSALCIVHATGVPAITGLVGDPALNWFEVDGRVDHLSYRDGRVCVVVNSAAPATPPSQTTAARIVEFNIVDDGWYNFHNPILGTVEETLVNGWQIVGVVDSSYGIIFATNIMNPVTSEIEYSFLCFWDEQMAVRRFTSETLLSVALVGNSLTYATSEGEATKIFYSSVDDVYQSSPQEIEYETQTYVSVGFWGVAGMTACGDQLVTHFSRDVQTQIWQAPVSNPVDPVAGRKILDSWDGEIVYRVASGVSVNTLFTIFSGDPSAMYSMNSSELTLDANVFLRLDWYHNMWCFSSECPDAP